MPNQTILFLAANPTDTQPLRLDQEMRDIGEGLQRSQQRDQFQLQQRMAARPRDIQRAMLDLNPQIIHFSGHGAGNEGLAFEDESRKTQFVSGEALADLFSLFADQLNCVVLNGCYSEVQAKAIAQHIPYVIGMNKAIGDKAAIAFAVGFYDALGAARDVEFAFKLGCSAIRLEGIAEHLTPVLIKKPATMGTAAPPNPAIGAQSAKSEAISSSGNQMIEVFFSYAHEDEKLRDELAKQLKLLERQGVISAWHDRQIVAGSEWGNAIDTHLDSAQVILLLISPDFLASDYCWDIEVKRAMERHEAGEARVIPVILRPVDYWQETSFGKLQALPTNAQPVTTWENRDEAFRIVAQGIRKVIADPPPTPPASHSAARSTKITVQESTSLTPGERRRLEMERDELQGQFDSLSEEIQFLQQSERTDDLSPKDRFRLKRQIEQAKQERQQLSEKITILENGLQ
jgi:TIR domain/CHAT domain